MSLGHCVTAAKQSTSFLCALYLACKKALLNFVHIYIYIYIYIFVYLFISYSAISRVSFPFRVNLYRKKPFEERNEQNCCHSLFKISLDRG